MIENAIIFIKEVLHFLFSYMELNLSLLVDLSEVFFFIFFISVKYPIKKF